MRFRGSVAIDLGTVNTLVWVAGRGIVLEEPTAIAIDANESEPGPILLQGDRGPVEFRASRRFAEAHRREIQLVDRRRAGG